MISKELKLKIKPNEQITVTIKANTNREMRYKAVLLAITKQYGWSETQINEVLALIEYD